MLVAGVAQAWVEAEPQAVDQRAFPNQAELAQVRGRQASFVKSGLGPLASAARGEQHGLLRRAPVHVVLGAGP